MGLLTDPACTGSARGMEGGMRSSCSPAAPRSRGAQPSQEEAAGSKALPWLQSSKPRAGSLHPGKIPAILGTGRQCWGCLKGCGDAQQGMRARESQENASQLCFCSPAVCSVQLHREAWQAFIWTALTAATILQTSALLHLLLLP